MKIQLHRKLGKFLLLVVVILSTMTGCGNQESIYTSERKYNSVANIDFEARLNDNEEIIGGGFGFVDPEGVQFPKGEIPVEAKVQTKISDLSQKWIETAKLPSKDEFDYSGLNYDIIEECFYAANLPEGTRVMSLKSKQY